MDPKSVLREEPRPPLDHERLQIRELIALTPAERVRLMVDSARNLMALLENTRPK